MKALFRISILFLVLLSLLLLTANALANYLAREETAVPDAALPLTDSQKAEIITAYAPRVWLSDKDEDHSTGEPYFPSPVEFSFQHMVRIWEPEDHELWWIYTYEVMSSPSDRLDFFHGCDGDPCHLSDVPVYAFWDEVEGVDIEGQSTDVVDIIYFFWFPYNRGKLVLLTTYGHHVGDWEHLSIRLIPEWDEGSGQWIYAPYQIYCSAHSFGYRYLWEDFPTVESTTHPIVYAAWGSHGIWKNPGRHEYNSTWGLADYCSPGTAWDTWEYVEAYDFDHKTGLIGNAYPTWMSDDYDNPEFGYSDPASGPIRRWGNDEDECGLNPYCRRNHGPTGPVDKDVWDVEVLK